jgi:hypothetical protein
MPGLPRWNRILSPLRSIRSLLILIACIAAFLGSFIHRQLRVDLQKKNRSIEMWHDVYATPNFNRMIGKSERVPKVSFRYPFAVDFGRQEKAAELLQVLPLCDSLRAIRWMNATISDEDAKLISKQSRCRSLQFTLTHDSSAIMRILDRMTWLQELSFDRCVVTQNDIELLCNAKQLKVVTFWNSGITRDQIHLLRESMPTTYVICMDWQ